MLFNSLSFFVFFPLISALYFAIPHRFRWMLLLAGSYYFYMCWKPEYIVLIVLSTLIDYGTGRKMGQTDVEADRRKYLLFSLFSNLGILFLFKYFNFFNESTRAVLNHFNIFYDVRGFELLLPVGISFYTFQSLSYSIDVYRGVRPPEKHLGIFALYVAFFPQLVAGPIERATTLLPQLRKTHEFDYERVTDGLKLMAWGMFKKVVIADRLAILVNTVYQNPTDYQGVPLIIATYFFAFQIYCDFSGYSDIAIGAAQVMGYKLMDNFKRPYFSTSIAEFWRRWHISLSTWFKDYLYIPLGGNRVVKWRWYVNLYVVFLISGLWHGANWTFVVWGAIHGFYLVFSIWTANFRRQVSAFFRLNRYPTIQNCWKVFITFHLVLFAWVFFRANTLQDAFYIVSHLFSNLEFKSSYGLELGRFEFAVAIFSILLMEFIHLIQSYQPIRPLLSQKPVWLRWGVYYVFVMALLMFGEFASPQAFVYFQF